MPITLRDIKTKLGDWRSDFTSGTVDINQEGVRAINGCIDWLFSRHEWPGTMVHTELTTYPTQQRYALPEDFYQPSSLVPSNDPENIAKYKTPQVVLSEIDCGQDISFAIEDGLSRNLILNISSLNNQSFVVMPTGSLDDGTITWVGSGDVTGLRSARSLRGKSTNDLCWNYSESTHDQQLTGISTADIDLDGLQMDGRILMDIRIPDITGLTDIVLSLQDSLGAYVTYTTTTQANGLPLEAGKYITVAFDMSSGVETGTVDYTKIRLVEPTFVTDASSSSSTNWRMTNIRASMPFVLLMNYYGKRMVKDVSTGTYGLHFDGTDELDEVNLPDECLDLVAMGSAWQLCQIMEQAEKAEKYRIMFCGQSGDAGEFKMKAQNYPSLRQMIMPQRMVPPIDLRTRKPFMNRSYGHR